MKISAALAPLVSYPPFAQVCAALPLNLYCCSNRCPIVQPDGSTQGHCHTTMGAGLLAIGGIIVPYVGTWSIHRSPPGVMQEKPPRIPFQRIVDICWRIPVGGILRPGGDERRRVEFLNNGVCTCWRCQFGTSTRNWCVIDLCPVLV